MCYTYDYLSRGSLPKRRASSANLTNTNIKYKLSIDILRRRKRMSHLPRGSSSTNFFIHTSRHSQSRAVGIRIHSPYISNCVQHLQFPISRALDIRFCTMSMDDNNIAVSVNNLSLSDDVYQLVIIVER